MVVGSGSEREPRSRRTAEVIVAMPRLSAGLLMYRIKDGAIQVLLAHPGGPFFVNKDDGAWSIPKGEPMPTRICSSRPSGSSRRRRA